MRRVYSVIRKMGITSKYNGYHFLAEAVLITIKYQDRPLRITKDVYPYLAKKYKSTPSNVEHDIRTVIDVSYYNHREVLEEIAGCSLSSKPSNTEVLDMLAYYLEEAEIQ